MKQCSVCNQTYDDSLKFCLADGTDLSQSFGREKFYPSSDVPQQVIRKPRPSIPGPLYVVVAVLVLVISVLATMLLRSDSNIVATSANEPLTNAANPPANHLDVGFSTPRNMSSSRSMSNSVANASNMLTPVLPPDVDLIGRSVSDRISNWKVASEARDLHSYMQNYAETVDYYKKKGASKSFVSGDKQRAFKKFESISLTIDIVSITPYPSGNRADAVIDKEWLFQGGGYLAGKVRQQLRFEQINGEWLIAGEKDLKVYYVNK